jgi:hypothetical protein
MIVFGRKESGVASLGGDPELSSRHAQLYGHEGSLVIHDLGSTNGTWVNDQLVSQPTILKPGDVLRMGATTLAVESANGVHDGGTQMGVAPVSDGGTQFGAAPVAAPVPPAPPAPPAAMVPPAVPPGPAPAGSPGASDNKPLIIVAAILAAVLVIGGIVGGVIALSGGDDGKKDQKGSSTTPVKPSPKPVSSTPATTPSTTPATPPPANQSGDVSIEDQSAIKNVIEAFQADVVGGDTTAACSLATDNFSVSGQPTDCPSWAQDNVNGDSLSLDSFKSTTIEGSSGPAVLVRVTNTQSGQSFDVAMDGETGHWRISDIAPASG